MLQNAVVLYRRTITFSYIVSTNQSRLYIPTVLAVNPAPSAAPHRVGVRQLVHQSTVVGQQQQPATPMVSGLLDTQIKVWLIINNVMKVVDI